MPGLSGRAAYPAKGCQAKLTGPGHGHARGRLLASFYGQVGQFAQLLQLLAELVQLVLVTVF